MSEDRKNDHIDLAFISVPKKSISLEGCYYEPLLSGHKEAPENIDFLAHNFKMPLWVSSMTGGAQRAQGINKNLAKACGEFGFGMGLGSCRSLLDSEARIKDFDVKEFMPNMPLYSNFGIAQLEELIDQGNLKIIDEVTKSLSCDGIIVHVNPLQEWAQPEGDRFRRAPIETIKSVLDQSTYPIIVKEVGQGFGPKSLKLLTDLPLAAIELSGFGGTNFTILEHARQTKPLSGKKSPIENLGHVGHSAAQMVDWLNQIVTEESKCKNFIISGGIKDPLQGHMLRHKLKSNSVIGMASSFLEHAMGEYDELRDYILEVRSVLGIAEAYIK